MASAAVVPFPGAPETEEEPMSPSRREFLAAAGAAGVLATFPPAAHAGFRASLLYPPMNPRELAAFDTPVHRGATALRYAGIQLRANAVDEFPDPHALRDLLAQHKLVFVAISSGVVSLDPAAGLSQLETHVQHARYLHEAGGLYLQLIGD